MATNGPAESAVTIDRADLAGRAAVVTGGGKGLGASLCAVLARAGMRVVVAEIDPRAGEQVARSLREGGHEALFVETNVGDPNSVDALAKTADDFAGHVDLLINNAGISRMGEIAAMPLDEWQHVINVNLWGVINGIRAFLPQMLERTGWRYICTVSSMGAFRPVRANAAYCAAKAGVHALMETLRLETAGSGIGISVSPPGRVLTSIFDGQDMAEIVRLSGGAADPSRVDARQPDEVAERMLEGIVRGDYYIITHPEVRSQVLPRLEEIRRAFGV